MGFFSFFGVLSRCDQRLSFRLPSNLSSKHLLFSHSASVRELFDVGTMATRSRRNIGGTSPKASITNDPDYRYQVSILEAVAEGTGNGKKMRLENIDTVADDLKVMPEHLLKFISAELGTQVQKSEIRGHWDESLLDLAVRRFEDVYLICHGVDDGDECQKPELDVCVAQDGMLKAKCRACGWRGYLDEKLKYEKVTKKIVEHLTETESKWCSNLKGEKAWKRVDVLGLSDGSQEIAKKGKREKKEKKEKTEKKGGDSEEPDASVEVDVPLLQAVIEENLENLEGRHAQELVDLKVKIDAHIESAKASAGKGKKGKEQVEAAEREAEEWNYNLWMQQKAELEFLLEGSTYVG